MGNIIILPVVSYDLKKTKQPFVMTWSPSSGDHDAFTVLPESLGLIRVTLVSFSQFSHSPSIFSDYSVSHTES